MQPTIQPDSVGPETEENVDNMMLAEKAQASDILQELTSVTKDLREFKCEMQNTLKDFQADLRKDVREELNTFKQDISQKLVETTTTLQAQGEAKLKCAYQNWKLTVR